MSGDLYTDIENLIRSISPRRIGTQKRASILANEVFVDVFMPLGRLSLDALQFTCRRFNDIVTDHLNDCCLRIFDSVWIMNLEYARTFDTCSPPPVGPTEKGVYRLAIQADFTELDESPRAPWILKYLFESKNVHELMSVMYTKLPKQCYIRWIDFSGLTEKLPALAREAEDTLRGLRLGCLMVNDTELRESWPYAHLEISAAGLLPLLDSFAAIRGLDLQRVRLTSTGSDFLDLCRTRGILSVFYRYGATVESDIGVNAVMRFCFGPVKKELEGNERELQGFSVFQGSMISRMYKAARSKPKHAVKLSMNFEGDGNAELRTLLDSNYQWDSEKNRYFLTMDNGITLYWWFDETEERIECELLPRPFQPTAEDTNKGVKD